LNLNSPHPKGPRVSYEGGVQITPVSRSLARASFGLIALAVASLSMHSACSPNSSGTGDAGTTDGGNSSDGGATSDAGITCTTDAQCGTKRYCEKSTGTCRDAKACPQGQGNCDYQAGGGDYCADGTCYCEPGDSSCKPLHLPCTACTTSPQCGNDPNEFDTPADCVPPGDGLAASQVCIPRRDGVSHGCPHGFTLPTDGGVYCTPAGGKCGAQGGCQSDNDCDPHGTTPICDTGRNVCVAACTFNLKTGASVCPNGQVCNLLPEFVSLPPSDPNFAKGRCGPPCVDNSTCGTGLVCRSEGLDVPVMRCGLPPPECLGDVECPNAPAAHSNGYCDLSTKACKTDCRTSSDCKAGYLCAGSNASLSCIAETCLQAGGAALGCNYGQFCCGEANSPACPGGVAQGQCFDAPALWCSTCSKNTDCTGSSDPSRSGEQNLCLQVASSKDVCAFGCHPNTSGECPSRWQCQQVTAGCGKDSDCGDQTGAKCNVEDGGNGTCTCGSTAECPQADTPSTCVSGSCAITNICRPNCP